MFGWSFRFSLFYWMVHHSFFHMIELVWCNKDLGFVDDLNDWMNEKKNIAAVILKLFSFWFCLSYKSKRLLTTVKDRAQSGFEWKERDSYSASHAKIATKHIRLSSSHSTYTRLCVCHYIENCLCLRSALFYMNVSISRLLETKNTYSVFWIACNSIKL